MEKRVIHNTNRLRAWGNHQNIKTSKGHTARLKQASILHPGLQQHHLDRCPILSGSKADRCPPLQCLSISTLVSPFGDQRNWHKRLYKKKNPTTHHCAWKGLSLGTNLRETMFSRVKQHTLTTFPRVRQSQWLHKGICCINLQYLKKALLSLHCIYKLIGFFLASK